MPEERYFVSHFRRNSLGVRPKCFLNTRVLCLRESLSAALEDRPLPKIQAGHAPHGERPEATHDETTQSRDDETDIQKAEIIWTT